MFEIGGKYANRIGEYIVLEINEPKMMVRYLDGTTAELRMNIQLRIWENILAEDETSNSRTDRKTRRYSGKKPRFYIRSFAFLGADETDDLSRKEFISSTNGQQLQPGDRLIYYAIETQVFFAVATITQASGKRTGSSGTESEDETVNVYQIDVDAQAESLKKAVPIDSVELESQPNIKKLIGESEIYMEINEDEFELLVEMLTEYSEEDDDGEEEEEELED
jgi:hypothetical protein